MKKILSIIIILASALISGFIVWEKKPMDNKEKEEKWNNMISRDLGAPAGVEISESTSERGKKENKAVLRAGRTLFFPQEWKVYKNVYALGEVKEQAWYTIERSPSDLNLVSLQEKKKKKRGEKKENTDEARE